MHSSHNITTDTTATAFPFKVALVYAQKCRWKVIPLHGVNGGQCTCEPRHDGKPCGGSKGKHPRLNDWVSHASDDPWQIGQWAQRFPLGNLGIVTGAVNGFFVLDVDPKNGGDATLAALLEEHGPLPETVTQATPSGGAHYLFKMPAHGVTNRAVGRGLDVRGEGGQIVAAPSRTHAGSYRWVRPPWETEIANAPAWLLSRLAAGPGTSSPRPMARGTFPPATPEVLARARAALVKHGPAIDGDNGGKHTVQAGMLLTHDFALTDDEAWPLLLEWNATCVPPWEPADLRKVALVHGEKYGREPYGSKRPIDTVGAARKLISDWQATPGAANDDGMLAMVRQVRALVAERCDDPVQREIIQDALIQATGRGARALDLPRVYRREPRAEPTELQSEWSALDLELGTNGAPVANMDNAVRVLEGRKHPAYFETFSQRIYGERGEWTDADTLALTLELQRDVGLLKMTPQIVTDAVRTYAHGRERDRVREAFAALRWDGVERIASFLSVVYGAPDSEYTRAASANFWKSLAARALQPGCKCDTMLVLEGVQGLKKSSSLRVLAGADLFAEASESPTSKDFFLALQGKLLVEVGEMDAFSRSEVAAVKRVLSCQEDRFRVPYGRATQTFPRRGVFVGTTNRSDWARDDTGARRFWPIACTRVDLAYIKTHREQMFAEAVARVNDNESWWEMPKDATEAEQEARRAAHPWEDIIADWLRQQQPRMDPGGKVEPEVRVTVLEVLRDCLHLDVAKMDRAAQMQVTSVLKRLEWERKDGWRQGGKQKFWRNMKKEAVGSPNPS